VKNTAKQTKARSKCRSIHAPNPTDELSTAEEQRLNHSTCVYFCLLAV